MSSRGLGEALRRAAGALDGAGIAFGLMGGMASSAVGRRRSTHDIDVFVAEPDAVPALDALAGAGFATQRTDETWLYKAWWRDAMVDVIFVSKGGVRFDEEMRERRHTVAVEDVRVPALAAEDLLLIKALATAEHVVRHWYDALAILAEGELDWDYLCRRSRRHPHRMLSLLCFAASDGIPVPVHVLRGLFEMAEERTDGVGAASGPPRVAADHLAAHIREALATEPLCEPHLAVDVTATEIVLHGKVATASRRAEAERVVRRLAGSRAVDSRIEVVG